MTVTKHISKKPLALAISSILLSASAFAGQIVTDAPEGDALKTATSTANTQFGFGGWNLDNVDVKIVNVTDFSTNIGTFNTADGTYSMMGVDMSFESDISTGGEVRGLLHGKDWPVGEPSGIKIINGDQNTKHGKPENCIMTSSFLDTGYLDVNGSGNPVLCSSHFQSHKRFKINLQPTTVDGISGDYGKPVELTFNLKAGDTSDQRYQVLQKLNNYTGKRLDGYKIEVLDATGNPNDELTLSLGIGENLTDPVNPEDIWDIESMANFSHGLWGPIDSHFDSNGFFDSKRAYYTPSLATDNKSVSYVGDMLGGNYQAIFGNWLPSIWEPSGIFHDDDMDPETDGALKAFWGDPEKTGTNAWHKGNDDSWAVATEEDLLIWTGEWYEHAEIEDVLNLGLNYIVNVGDNDAIGSTFTVRITPHVAADQTIPAYVANPAPTSGYSESEGIIVADLQLVVEETVIAPTAAIAKESTDTSVKVIAPYEVKAFAATDKTLIKLGVLNIGVADNDLNVDPAVKETLDIEVTSDHGETETVTLTESDVNTSRFVGTVDVEVSDDAAVNNDGKFLLNQLTNLKATYVDTKYGAQAGPETLEASVKVEVDKAPVVVIPDTGSSSSFDAYDNKSFFMMFFGFIGIGLLMARRRLGKVTSK